MRTGRISVPIGLRVGLRACGWAASTVAGADFNQANLYQANLYQANLYQANLAGANLAGAYLAGVTGWDSVKGKDGIIGLEYARDVPD